MSDPKKLRDAPNMSDQTILMTVEDLICMAMGPPHKNTVNFKVIETILTILARQLRLLETHVEVRGYDLEEASEEESSGGKGKREKGKKLPKKSQKSSPGSSPDSSDRHSRKIYTDDYDKRSTSKAERESMRKSEEEREGRGRSEERDGGKYRKSEEDKRGRDRTSRRQSVDSRGTRSRSRKESDDEGHGKRRPRRASLESQRSKKGIPKGRRTSDTEPVPRGRSSGRRESDDERDVKGRKKGRRESSDEDDEVKKGGKGGKGRKRRDSNDDDNADETSKKKGKRLGQASSTIITEEVRGQDKVLVVDKGGPASPTRTRMRGSIEVVTVSEFDILKKTVRALQQVSGPLPALTLPANDELRKAITSGTASLTDTMQAMQVDARVQAAEAVITRLTGLLTQMASTGIFPPEFAMRVAKVGADYANVTAAIDPQGKSTVLLEDEEGLLGTGQTREDALSRMTLYGVNKNDLEAAIKATRDDVLKQLSGSTSKASSSADAAIILARGLSEKLEVAMKINNRIDTITSYVADNVEQLNGFHAGLNSQMQSFQDMMTQMRSDLKGGLALLERTNQNSETAAVMELTERFEGLTQELERSLHDHSMLQLYQIQLGDEIKKLIEAVEVIREQKSDRDEVVDLLRDKADLARLGGLLSEERFDLCNQQLARKLELCYDKFDKQDRVWREALDELSLVTGDKAEVTALLAARGEAEARLKDLNSKVMYLAEVVGEPKAALITRKMAAGASCGACLAPALMEMRDLSYGKPPPLPALRHQLQHEETCKRAWQLPVPTDTRDHACHRWAGGSHTVLTNAGRARAGAPDLPVTHTRKYADFGDDGRLYQFEVELEPCKECNTEHGEGPPPSAEGGGDQAEALLPFPEDIILE